MFIYSKTRSPCSRSALEQTRRPPGTDRWDNPTRDGVAASQSFNEREHPAAIFRMRSSPDAGLKTHGMNRRRRYTRRQYLRSSNRVYAQFRSSIGMGQICSYGAHLMSRTGLRALLKKLSRQNSRLDLARGGCLVTLAKTLHHEERKPAKPSI